MGMVAPALAIPQSFFGNGFFGPVIPATPRFGANLTREFLDSGLWVSGDLPGPWEETGNGGTRRMTANPVLFGAVPDSVTATRSGGKIERVEITYLDAGTFFRFKLGGEKSHQDREAGEARRAEFDALFRKLSSDLAKRLGEGCERPVPVTVGRTDLLRATYFDYRWEDFTLRLAARDGHSVGLRLTRTSDRKPEGYLAPEVAKLGREERVAALASRRRENERGDVLLGGIPVVDQGNTPFCGIHALAMVSRYLGLEITPDELAAAARFRNTGSARGSLVLDLYHAVGEEAGMEVKVSSRFDAKRVLKSLEAGLPVIVWRRVTKEREDAHAALGVRLAENPDARVPVSKSSVWPRREKKSLPSHGSVVTGINLDRGEAIYSEPWGESARERRMSLDELETSTYAVFFFRFEERG